jgi:LemA protein
MLIFIVIIYNRIIQLDNNIGKAWSNIDVSLKQRSNELPNLINTVKGYMTYEKTLLETITKARSYLSQEKDLHKKAAASDIISESLKSLFAIIENYPELKSVENFTHLQKRITALENEIADRREYYNECVTIYNITIQSFPDLIIAKLVNVKEKDLFKATEKDKQYVKVNF